MDGKYKRSLNNSSELELRADKNAPQEFAFILTNNTKIIEAQQLSSANNQRKFSQLNEFGLLIFDENGKYTFYFF